jgi:hypothetical protein
MRRDSHRRVSATKCSNITNQCERVLDLKPAHIVIGTKVSDSAIAQYVEDNPTPTHKYQHRISHPLPDFDPDPTFRDLTVKIIDFSEGERPQHYGIYLVLMIYGT